MRWYIREVEPKTNDWSDANLHSMTNGRISFKPFHAADKMACLAVFDANCPEYFAPNERTDYERFLDSVPEGYEVCMLEGKMAGAFGLTRNSETSLSLDWIMIDPHRHGAGLGSSIMKRVFDAGRRSGVSLITIAASHKSAPFFEKFGAVPINTIMHGWGPGMTRIDMELSLTPST